MLEERVKILKHIHEQIDRNKSNLLSRYSKYYDLKNIFNTYAGSAFGISHNLNQSLVFRPQCTLPKIKNLYFTGASIHPGNGTSMVLKSSKICSEIIKE